MRDHAQRIGDQSPSDGIDGAQRGAGEAEPEQARQPPERDAIGAPARHAQDQVGDPERPAPVDVEPHPHERHERPRGALAGLDHDDEEGEEHQRDEQRPGRPVPRAHGQEGTAGEDPPAQLPGRAGQHPPQSGQQRAQHGVEYLESVATCHVLDSAVQHRGQPRFHHPGTADRREGVGVASGDAVGEDQPARGDMGEERVVVEALETDDSPPDDEGAAGDGRDPWRAHGSQSGRQ